MPPSRDEVSAALYPLADRRRRTAGVSAKADTAPGAVVKALRSSSSPWWSVELAIDVGGGGPA
jgi:hypothetical protein